MAKEKKEKRCKECEGQGKDCKCPKKGKVGFYGLDRHYDGDGDNHESPIGQDEGGGDGGGGMSEAIKMPKAPTDADKHTKGMSSEKKRKSLDSFRASANDAKKRQGDKDRKDELAVERIRKGVRFYDSKGSGYMKGGKKTYD